MEKQQIGIINEIGDLGLGFTPISEPIPAIVIDEQQEEVKQDDE